jgi:hypothetical protein
MTYTQETATCFVIQVVLSVFTQIEVLRVRNRKFWKKNHLITDEQI